MFLIRIGRCLGLLIAFFGSKLTLSPPFSAHKSEISNYMIDHLQPNLLQSLLQYIFTTWHESFQYSMRDAQYYRCLGIKTRAFGQMCQQYSLLIYFFFSLHASFSAVYTICCCWHSNEYSGSLK